MERIILLWISLYLSLFNTVSIDESSSLIDGMDEVYIQEEAEMTVKESRQTWMEEMKNQDCSYGEYGSTPSNILNGAFASNSRSWVVEDDEYYYLAYTKYGRMNSENDDKSGIYRIAKEDISSSKKVLDGELLISGKCYCLLVYKGFLYFNYGDYNELGRLDLSTGEYEVLFESDGKVYYMPCQIYKDQLLVDTYNGKVSRLFLYDVSSGQATNVDLGDAQKVKFSYIAGEWIFLFIDTAEYLGGLITNDDCTGLYRRNIKTGEMERLTEEDTFAYVVEEDKIYRLLWEGDNSSYGNRSLYRMNLDGSGKERLFNRENVLESLYIYGDTAVTSYHHTVYVINLKNGDQYDIDASWGVSSAQLLHNNLFYRRTDDYNEWYACVIDLVTGKDRLLDFVEVSDGIRVRVVEVE